MKNLLYIFALMLPASIWAQVPLNTNIDVKANIPLDNRTVIDSLSDTTSIIYPYEGLIVRAKDVDAYYEYTGTKWQIFSGGSGLDSLVQSGRQFTFYAGDSSYSMNSIDTFIFDNGSYKIVVGTDTLEASLNVDFGNVLFVSPDGDDVTAEKGNSLKPWSRLDSAYVNSSDGDIIIMLKDSFYSNYTIDLVDGKDLFLFMEDGTIWNADGFRQINGNNLTGPLSVTVIGNALIYIKGVRFMELDNGDNGLISLVMDGLTFDGDDSGFGLYQAGQIVELNDMVSSSISLNEVRNGVQISLSSISQSDVNINLKNLLSNPATGSFSATYGNFISVSGLTDSSSISVNVDNLAFAPQTTSVGAPYRGVLSFASSSNFQDATINVTINNIDADMNLSGSYNDFKDLFSIEGTFTNSDIGFTVNNGTIEGMHLIDEIGLSGNSSNLNMYFSGNFNIKNDYVIGSYSNQTETCSNCNIYFDGIFTGDSTLFDIKHNGTWNYYFSGRYKTTSDNSPIFDLNTNIPIYIEGAILETNSTQAPIQGASGTVYLSGDVVSYSDSLDTDITHNFKRNFGSNSIYDRLLFGNYTIDGNTNTLSIIGTTDQNYLSTRDASIGGYRQTIVGLNDSSSNTIIQADSLIRIEDAQNIIVGTNPNDYSTMSPTTSDDDIAYVFVQDESGFLKKTTRLLPMFDTLTMTGSTDTFNLDYAMDMSLTMDATSASATTTITIQNPVPGTTLDFSFINVGSTITVNFSHYDRSDHTSQSSFTVSADGDKMFRYKPDGNWWSTN